MNRKIIAEKLAEKFNDWLGSIKDERVKKLVAQNTIITGGCIASMFLKEKVSDFDFYFKTQEVAYAVAEYYINILNKAQLRKIRVRKQFKEVGNNVNIFVKSAGILETVKKEGEKYYPIFVTKNAITLSENVQCIIRFVGQPEKICNEFDFIHITNYWCSWGQELIVNPKAIESLLNKELIYKGSKFSIASLFRVKKFLAKGWSISVAQLLKLSFDINRLDLENFDSLEDQLVGVDVTYLMDFIKELRDIGANNKLDGSYVVEILTRMYDAV
jgi:hypothetical protein